MIKPNEEIRKMCTERKIPLWKVAEKLKISDQTFYRWLRHEFDDQQRDKIIQIIEELTTELKKMA